MTREPAYLRALKPPRYLEAVARAKRSTVPYAPKVLPSAAQVQDALRKKALRQALAEGAKQA